MHLSAPLHCLLATALLLGASPCLAQSRLLADLTTGSAGSFPNSSKTTMEAEHINGNYYVAVGCRIYRTDGVAAAATPVVEMSGSGCTTLSILGRLGERLVFMRNRDEIWSTDGNVGTQVELPVLVPDPVNDEISGFYHWPRYPGWMLILVDKFGNRTDEVWLTDGSVANTRMVQGTGIGASVAFLRNGRAALLGSGLWTLDSPTATANLVSAGFTEGRALFSGIDRAFTPPNRGPVTETDTRVYFTARTAAAGTEPWSSNLTPSGTALLVDHTPGAASSTLQWAGTPGGDDSYYFVAGDQLFRGTPGSGAAAQINPSGTIIGINDDLGVAPIHALDGDVMLARVTENTGKRIWKLRDSVPGSFAPAVGSPVYANAVNSISWFVRWPDRALFGSSGAGSGGVGVVAAQVAASPADVTLTPFTGGLLSIVRSDLRLDQYLQWTDFYGARRLRRNATTFDSLPLFPESGEALKNFHARPGGALALFAHSTPITGREPHALDLLPNEIPLCNRPGLNVPDNGSAQDSIVVLPNGLAAGDVVLDLRLSLKLRHSYVGDLRVTLQHAPSGRSATVLDRPGVPQQSSVGCSGRDLDVIFDDAASTSVESCGSTQAYGALVSLQPEQPLGTFRGMNPVGTWTLTVVDASGSDFGGVTEWCLDMAAAPQSNEVFRDGFESISGAR